MMGGEVEERVTLLFNISDSTCHFSSLNLAEIVEIGHVHYIWTLHAKRQLHLDGR